MEPFTAFCILIIMIASIASIPISFIALIFVEDSEEKIYAFTLFIVAILILFSFYGLEYQHANIQTHYKINPRIEVVEYEDNYGKIYKDTVYIYKPKFR